MSFVSVHTYSIYAIKNMAVNRVYIGKALHVEMRLQEHRHALSVGRHHNKALQADWQQYGERAFSFEVLESMNFDVDLGEHWSTRIPYCDYQNQRARQREQLWLDRFSNSELYNAMPAARKSAPEQRKQQKGGK